MRTMLNIFLAVLMLYAVPSTFAQSPQILEEVVVTAQRRQQSLDDVPISVSVTKGIEIDTQNIKEAQDYLSITPNVTFSEEGQRGERSIAIAIRGVNNISVLENRGGGSAIGYYYDEVSLGAVSQGTANPQLIDVERIEVLRGPQGTFFGLSATGGALNILTRSPNEKQHGELNAEVGNHEQWAVSGIYNAPISDDLFVRGVVSVEETPAVVENVDPVGGDSGSFNQTYRFSARYEPVDELRIQAKVTYSDEEQDLAALVPTCRLGSSSQTLLSLDNGVRILGFPAPIPAGIDGAIDDGLGCFPDNDDKVDKSTAGAGERKTESIKNDMLIFSGHITYETDLFTIESITGYVDSQNQARFDLDAVDGNFVNRKNNDTTDAWSEEIRLSSNGKSLDWVVGGFYFESNQERRNLITADTERFFVFRPLATLNQFFQTTEVESFAFFGDVNWHVTDSFTLTAGGRYSENEITQCAQNLSPGTEVPFTCANSAKTDDFSPRFALTVDWSDSVTSYLSVSRGYKPGGSQVEGSQVGGQYMPSFFGKETLWNYELGVKATLFDNRMRVNAALFYMDWKNLQVDDTAFVVNPVTNMTETATFIRRAKKATSKGVEIEFVALPWDNMTIGGGVGFTDATFGDFDGIARPQGKGPVDLSGEQIPGAAEWTASFYGEQRFPLMGYESYIRLEWFYRDEVVPNLDGYFFRITDPAVLGFVENDGDTYPFVVPSYDVLNLRAGVQVKNWRLIAYADNVLEEDYFTGARYGFRLNGINVRPHPRQVGVKATYTWE